MRTAARQVLVSLANLPLQFGPVWFVVSRRSQFKTIHPVVSLSDKIIHGLHRLDTQLSLRLAAILDLYAGVLGISGNSLGYASAQQLLTWPSSCHWFHAKIKRSLPWSFADFYTTMGLTISSLFNRLFGKTNMRILMGKIALNCS